MSLNEKSKIHKEICNKLNAVYLLKNHDYGDSFGKSYKEYGLTMACIRLEDKLNRLKSLTKTDALVKDESIEDTLHDLANYAIMTIIERTLENKEKTKTEKPATWGKVDNIFTDGILTYTNKGFLKEDPDEEKLIARIKDSYGDLLHVSSGNN